jgi:hypothetical protein
MVIKVKGSKKPPPAASRPPQDLCWVKRTIFVVSENI